MEFRGILILIATNTCSALLNQDYATMKDICAQNGIALADHLDAMAAFYSFTNRLNLAPSGEALKLS